MQRGYILENSVLARCKGYTEVADLLKRTLDNEKETDVALTKVAESYINDHAAEE